MELYGGGMVGNRTNYQLGGRVAASRRGREYAGEVRGLNRLAEIAGRRRGIAGALGDIFSTVGAVAGSAIPIPGVGTAVGAGIGSAIGGGLGRLLGESTYKRTDVGGGKYARETRGELQADIDDYRRSMGERALTQGLRSGLGTFISSGGLGEVQDFFARRYGIDPRGRFAKKVTQQGLADNPFLRTEGLEELTDDQLLDFLPANPEYNPLPTPTRPDVPITAESIGMPDDFSVTDLSEIPETQLADINYDDLIQYGTFQGPSMDYLPATSPTAAEIDFSQPYTMSLDAMAPDTTMNIAPEMPSTSTGTIDFTQPYTLSFEQGGLINMMPQYQYGGFVKEAEKERFDAINRPTSFGDQANSAGENRAFMPPPPPSPPPPPPPPAPPASPYVPGYGTATDVQGALSQLGMSDIYSDPRFAQYMGDLPQFGMGYAQQIGDIYAGGQQAARGIRAEQRQAAGQRGFAGSGIGQRQVQQAFGDLTTDIARQRRGVVEGFQADLLSAIEDIERKGEFEFGQGPTSTTTPSDAARLISEAKALINSGNFADRARGEAALQQLRDQGYDVS